MTRVLQLLAGAPQGGAEAFFERLVPALAEAGIDQKAVLRRHTDRSAHLRARGIDCAEARFGGPLDLITPRIVTREARRFRPDVVLAWMSRAARVAPRGPWTTAARLGGYYDLRYYRRCQHLIGNTKGLRDYFLAKGWPRERAWYIPNFVDTAPAEPVDRASLTTPAGAPVVLAAGRLHPNKAFDTALSAVSQVEDAHLWIAGAGPLADRLAAQARDQGIGDRTRFLGWRSDVPALLASADVFLCSSRHEPLGNVVLEAWAHGTPVVSTDADGPAELIEHERTGLLVPVDAPDPIADALRRLIGDRTLAESLSEAGRRRVETDFSRDAVVERYRDFFETVKR